MPEQIVIPTDRRGVVLRQLTTADSETLFSLIDRNRVHLSQFNDNTAEKYKDAASVHKSIEQPENPLKIRLGIWSAGELFGTVNLTPRSFYEAEVGYWVGRQYTRQGLATLAVKTLARFATTKRTFRFLTAHTHPDNIASQKVLLAAGFKRWNEEAPGWKHFALGEASILNLR